MEREASYKLKNERHVMLPGGSRFYFKTGDKFRVDGEYVGQPGDAKMLVIHVPGCAPIAVDNSWFDIADSGRSFNPCIKYSSPNEPAFL